MSQRRVSIVQVLLILVIAFLVTWLSRLFVIELYTVAPLQMENTLLPGDRVLVEKWHYGARLPQYYFSIPGVDTIPGTDVPAHIPSQPLPYRRCALKQVERNDVIVYNYPTGKSCPIAQYPTAMARCIGVPGDTVKALNGSLFINGEPSAQSPVVTEAYLVADTVLLQVEDAMRDALGEILPKQQLGSTYLFYIDRYRYDKLCEVLPPTIHLQQVQLAYDNYTIDLPPVDRDAVVTPQNAAFYARIINQYEPHKVQLCGDALYRGGRKIERYRFTQPYYWVLCDNRTAATDSRVFGVLPHSHVIGRCGIILFSIDASQTGVSSWRINRFFQYRRL